MKTNVEWFVDEVQATDVLIMLSKQAVVFPTTSVQDLSMIVDCSKPNEKISVSMRFNFHLWTSFMWSQKIM